MPERVGWHNVMATLNELAIVAIAARLLGWIPVSRERIEWGTRAIAIPLLAATLLAGSLTHEH